MNAPALIFDMDGTMVDSMPYHLKSWGVFAQRHGQIMCFRFLGLLPRSAGRRHKELGLWIAPKLMAEHAEGAGAIAEVTGDFVGRAALDEEGAQGFVHALARVGWRGEEAAARRYVFRCSDSHVYMLLHTSHGCQHLSPTQ